MEQVMVVIDSILGVLGVSIGTALIFFFKALRDSMKRSKKRELLQWRLIAAIERIIIDKNGISDENHKILDELTDELSKLMEE